MSARRSSLAIAGWFTCNVLPTAFWVIARALRNS